MSPLTALESLLAYAPFQRNAASPVYDEKAFRHFLALERKRAEQSSRSFLLLLVSFKKDHRGSATVPASVAGHLFSALEACVREVDFIGWYRDGRVVAAVLTQGAEPPAGALRPIADRVTGLLDRRLPAQLADRLHVRVIPVRGGAQC
jgi:hypothetical protein